MPQAIPESERVARAFHEAYERLAPVFGWETQRASRVAWEDVPTENKLLMVAVVSDLLAENVISIGSGISCGGSATELATAKPGGARSSWCPS